MNSIYFTADIAVASIGNGTINSVSNKLDVEAINKKLDFIDFDTRRQRRKNTHRSTSSSSGEKKHSDGESGVSGESLEESSSSSSEQRVRPAQPKSSAERPGWRKWHRKCTPCPEEMGMKWRDPRIKWICGAYQRARRSFKSLCMMHLRNCQDGTMFTKIHDHRCKDDEAGAEAPHGDHFFYDYKVRMSGDTSNTEDSESTSLEDSYVSV
ncbi:uncharacterized protein LOC114365814 [Ostrinia furnacalis]|uniref:uncharacterized protein LOC114365814 n=1 Tax=Ostrinia furnacalis TaxID=93504 RepID=UPI00103F25EB|nr:uncharacterized protein LOC114365814 [Ostrinia furnacalis]